MKKLQDEINADMTFFQRLVNIGDAFGYDAEAWGGGEIAIKK